MRLLRFILGRQTQFWSMFSQPRHGGCNVSLAPGFNEEGWLRLGLESRFKVCRGFTMASDGFK